MKTQLIGRITREKLADWVEANKPELAIDEQNGTKGFYNRNLGQAWSFRGQGESWRDVAAALGAIEVPDAEG